MPKIICTLPNASDEISGVKFTSVEGGMLSEEIDDDAAELFLSIPGYKLADDEAGKKAASTSADEVAALRARATELGIDFKANWGVAKLTAAIAEAEGKQAQT